ncbi:hypothetical protein DXV75_13830 [Alteromonas aestuariivivens]|uniref:Uncharacterized protein n=1 Tax=Alteromonas aestuariivivens TaxID=1938339 RepID=A0A3D8M419_9ALTE|nr:hypothetical protein [Alteromonas aestuariivivens]RDV24497.1 hypothetical protein DXV75_13830 [Alteromonas aestuariivivens]
MANDSRNDEFPTIRLDEEDRRSYQQKKHSAAPAPKSPDSMTSPGTVSAQKSGGNGLWITLVAVIALAGCVGCYYLYTLLEQQKAEALSADNRIAQLERKLSATGEEIGESTVALQVKVTELTEKTNELWDQMDKLWASAWRRNQQEISDLGDKVNSVQSSLKSSVDSVSENVSSQKSQLVSLNNQLASLADEILALNVQLEQAGNDKQSQAQSIKNLTDKLSVLEQRNSSLSGRITGMENEIREIATKVVSKSGAGTPGPAVPAQ